MTILRHIEEKCLEEGTPFSRWSVIALLSESEFQFRGHVLSRFTHQTDLLWNAWSWAWEVDRTIKIDSYAHLQVLRRSQRTMGPFCILNGHRRGGPFCPHPWISGFPSYENCMLMCEFQSNYWDLRAPLSRNCCLTRQASLTWSLWCLTLTHGPTCSLLDCGAWILWFDHIWLLTSFCPACVCVYKHVCRLAHVHNEYILASLLKFIVEIMMRSTLGHIQFQGGEKQFVLLRQR